MDMCSRFHSVDPEPILAAANSPTPRIRPNLRADRSTLRGFHSQQFSETPSRRAASYSAVLFPHATDGRSPTHHQTRRGEPSKTSRHRRGVPRRPRSHAGRSTLQRTVTLHSELLRGLPTYFSPLVGQIASIIGSRRGQARRVGRSPLDLCTPNPYRT